MTELKARVSGLKTFCTARYLRKSASRGFGWLSILKDVYSKQCRLLCRFSAAGNNETLPALKRPAAEKRQGTKSREVGH
jgi:hypothetical protein